MRGVQSLIVGRGEMGILYVCCSDVMSPFFSYPCNLVLMKTIKRESFVHILMVVNSVFSVFGIF